MNHPFTETFIAMAKAAKEIQAMKPNPRQLDAGEWFEDFRGPAAAGYGELDGWDKPWLPRLDQLLGMLREIESGIEIYFNRGDDAHEKLLHWLMDLKYDKVWSDGAWQKN